MIIREAGGPEVHQAGGQLRIFLVVSGIVFVFYCIAWPQAPLMTTDTPSYMRVAADIRNETISRFHQRTPGYPLLLAATGSHRELKRPLFYVMLGAQLAAALLIAWTLARLGLSRRAVVAVFMVGISPPYVAPSAYALTESVSTLAIVGAFAAVILWVIRRRATYLWLFIVASTYAAFVRPTFELLVPAVAVGLLGAYWSGWAGTKRVAPLMVAMTAATAITVGSLGAYATINFRMFGEFDTSSMGAAAVSSRVATVLEYLPEEKASLRSVLVRARDRLLTEPFRNHTGLDYIYRAMPELLTMYNGDEVRALREVRQASWYLVKQKPFTYVHESMKVIPSFWMPNDYDMPGLDRGLGRAVSAFLQAAVNGVFLAQTIVVCGLMFTHMALCRSRGWRGLWLVGDRDKTLGCAYLIALAMIAYTMVVSCFLGVGDNRYRVPVEMLILANIGIGMTIWNRFVEPLEQAIRRFRGRQPLQDSMALGRELGLQDLTAVAENRRGA
jgi:hypothetical protein